MSTWKNVGMTYLKYADLCATHVRNALKEPMKTKAQSLSDMHVRIMQWEGGKRGAPGVQSSSAAPLSFPTFSLRARRMANITGPGRRGTLVTPAESTRGASLESYHSRACACALQPLYLRTSHT